MSTRWIGLLITLIVLAGLAWYTTWDTTVEQSAPTQAPADSEQEADSVETAQLTAVGTYEGSGTATRSFDGTTFTHTVTARIDDPAEGKFYEGWLVIKTADGPNFFSTGELVKEGEEYTLTYTAPQNYPDHTDVVITEETLSMGLDGQPEEHVLEGSFE